MILNGWKESLIQCCVLQLDWIDCRSQIEMVSSHCPTELYGNIVYKAWKLLISWNRCLPAVTKIYCLIWQLFSGICCHWLEEAFAAYNASQHWCIAFKAFWNGLQCTVFIEKYLVFYFILGINALGAGINVKCSNRGQMRHERTLLSVLS